MKGNIFKKGKKYKKKRKQNKKRFSYLHFKHLHMLTSK